MRWRLFKLDWHYTIGELFIVTIGVLLALAIDQWNAGRLERIEEVQIVERLMADLQSDQDGLQQGLDVLVEKEESLQRVYDVLTSPNPSPLDRAQFLDDVIFGSDYGWNQHTARRTTIDELLGSGSFRLIRSAQIRESISEYYDSDEGTNNRIEERETEYPNISYQLALRVNEFDVDPTLTDAQLAAFTAGVLDYPLLPHVVAEINFARFVRGRFIALQAARDDLAQQLEGYLLSIR